MSIRRLGRRKSLGPSLQELEQIIHKQPTYPGVAVHICTEDVKQELQKAGINLPTTPTKQTLKFVDLNKKLQIKSGSESIQGDRDHMEDRHVCFDDVKPQIQNIDYPENVHLSFYGIYDGHAGFRAAEMCKDQLHTHIITNHFFSNSTGAIQDGLANLDDKIIATGTNEGWFEGSCVSIVIILDNILYSANLGDSHIVLARKWKKIEAIHLSESHKPSVAAEKQRITKAGGMVMRNRLFGDLSISRALGDLNYKKPKQTENFVSNVAFIRQVTLTPLNRFIIVASDGIWDVFSYIEAVEFVYQNLKEHKFCATELSKLLVNEAKNRGSGDNITVVIVLLDWVKVGS